METFDLAVLGLGTGGEYLAGRLAERGLRVLGVDHALVAGVCAYWGCIPTKMMVRAAHSLAEARRVPALAGEVDQVRPDWGKVARRIREEATDDWDDRVAVERFESKGGTFLRGTGRLAGDRLLDVDGTTYRLTKGVVVATGSRPAIPPLAGLDTVPYWTNREAVQARNLRASILILGGGAIGCELAQVYARFGVHVTIVETADHLLPPEEPEAGDLLKEILEGEGVRVRLGSTARRVDHDGDGVALVLGDDVVRAERLLVATGRRTDPAAAGLETVGVDASARFAPVDERCRVSDGVWAIGDITGKGAFTHVAMYQAGIVVADILGEDHPPARYDPLPRVTFTDPEVGSVGLTERQARERLTHVRVGSVPLSSTSRGWIHGPGNDGLIKLVADAERQVLVGATAMGPTGGEVLGALSVAVHAAVPLATLRSMIYAYPTFHRGIEVALESLSD